jgi:hypothetical protein
MTQTKALKRSLMVIGALVSVVILVTANSLHGGTRTNENAERWEYLAVAGPSTTNLTPTNNPRMRKEPNAAFAREAFVLEQHLDKLGASGWELVAVAGPPTDPAYYFKRRK